MIFIKSVDSTNTYLKNMAENGAPDRIAVVAETQKKGRCRLSRSFFSPPDTGLYMSILVRSEHPQTKITTMAAVAVCRAVERIFNLETGIKWVNDVFVSGKKVCGILTEGVTGSDGFFAVVGIGINIFSPREGFPEELKNIAGSICNNLPDKKTIKKTAESIYTEFFDIYENNDYISEYKKRCFIIGKTVTLPDNTRGVVVDVDEEIRLVVKKETGNIISLESGEIKLKYE